MAIQYYIWENDTGEITYSGRQPDSPELRALATAGKTFVEVPQGEECPSAAFHSIDPATETVVPRLERLVGLKKGVLKEACSSEITGGFRANAAGTPLFYPSGETDQTNLIHAGQVGGDLWARNDSGEWLLTPHTDTEAKAVLTAFVTFKDGLRAKLAAKMVALTSATTAADVDAVVW